MTTEFNNNTVQVKEEKELTDTQKKIAKTKLAIVNVKAIEKLEKEVARLEKSIALNSSLERFNNASMVTLLSFYMFILGRYHLFGLQEIHQYWNIFSNQLRFSTLQYLPFATFS